MRLLHTLKGYMGQVKSVAFSPDGTQVVTGSVDKTAKIWDVKTGVELRTLKGHTGSVYSVAFSADGSRIVTGSWDKTAKVWDATISPERLALARAVHLNPGDIAAKAALADLMEEEGDEEEARRMRETLYVKEG